MSNKVMLKVPVSAKLSRKSGSSTPQAEFRSVSKKKRRLDSDDESFEHPDGKRLQLSEPSDRVRDREAEVDITNFEDDDNLPLASPRRLSSSPMSTANSRRGSIKVSAATSKRKQKKKNVVYSDNDDDDDDDENDNDNEQVAVGSISKDDKDDDFVPSPPLHRSSKVGKKAAITGKSKTKGVAGNVVGSIAARDDRKASSTETVSSAGATGKSAGMKRSRPEREGELVDEPTNALEQSTALQEVTPTVEEPPPVYKKKKLPTIKKNKPLTAAAPTSGTSTPASTLSTAKVGSSATATGAPPSLSVTNAPPTRKSAATAGNTDIDLTNSDIYNSLFKAAGGTTPKSGLNRREKEEERRKELDRMRDQARATRMAELQKASFDLLAAQDKVTRFEAMLKERNSVALFPHHLAAYLKHKSV